MKAGSELLLVARFTIALSTVAVAHLVDVDSRSRLSLWADMFNAGHVVLMGAFSLVMLWLSTDALARRFSNRLSHYAVAFSVTVAIGALSEVAQIPGPRNADALDVARDAAGAFCFLGLKTIWDRSLAPLWQRCGTWVRPAVAALILVTLALSWSAALRWGLAFYYRDTRFPVLCTFDSWWEHLFWTTRNASLEPVASPAGWYKGSHEGKAGKVVFRPSPRSGFAINRVFPDWSAHQALQLSVYLDSDEPVAFVVQVEDTHFNGSTGDRLTFVSHVDPGANRVAIPLDSTYLLQSARPLDLHRIAKVYFLTMGNTQTTTLYIDNVHLR